MPVFAIKSAPEVKKVMVVVNGTEREGIVDCNGRVQVSLSGAEYYYIASDDESVGLPRFGDTGRSEALATPFAPGASTPFEEVRGSPGRPVEEFVAAKPPAPPPSSLCVSRMGFGGAEL